MRKTILIAWLSIIICPLISAAPKKTTTEVSPTEYQAVVDLLQETSEVLKAARATIIAQDEKIQEKDDIIASLTDRAERESSLRRNLEAENASLRKEVKSLDRNRKILLTGLVVGATMFAGVHLYQVWSP